MVTFFPQTVWFLIIDDTFVYRPSKKGPDSGIYHQHGNKANRQGKETLRHPLAFAPDAADAMAEKGTGDRRASSFGPALVFQQCPGSGLVAPDMP
jgi:hypothetical protein